jgi:hypothetical protein
MRKIIDENGYLALDEFVADMPSFKRILADNRITDEEFIEQAQHVLTLIRKVDDALDEPERELVWNMLGELAVLFELQAIREGDGV